MKGMQAVTDEEEWLLTMEVLARRGAWVLLAK